ncbi:uncharacterized protein VK521_002485 isoform 2-T4 [Ammospiza maritima maritima]
MEEEGLGPHPGWAAAPTGTTSASPLPVVCAVFVNTLPPDVFSTWETRRPACRPRWSLVPLGVNRSKKGSMKWTLQGEVCLPSNLWSSGKAVARWAFVLPRHTNSHSACLMNKPAIRLMLQVTLSSTKQLEYRAQKMRSTSLEASSSIQETRYSLWVCLPPNFVLHPKT